MNQSLFTIMSDGKFVVSALNSEMSVTSYLDICGVEINEIVREYLDHTSNDVELMAGMLAGACIRSAPYDVTTMSDVVPEAYAKQVKEAAIEFAAVLELAVGEFFDQVRYIPKGIRLASEAIAENTTKCKNACTYNEYWTPFLTRQCVCK